MEIVHWIQLSIILHPEGMGAERPKELLFQYDLPREVYERRRWVVNWRYCRMQCQYPRSHISLSSYFYDKKTGLDIGYGSLISKVTGARGVITKTKNKMAAYKSSYVPTIFSPTVEETEEYKNAEIKLKNYKVKLRQLEGELYQYISNT